jgi:hypothetical protein
MGTGCRQQGASGILEAICMQPVEIGVESAIRVRCRESWSTRPA